MNNNIKQTKTNFLSFKDFFKLIETEIITKQKEHITNETVNILMQAPLFTLSGYGARSRDIAKKLITLNDKKPTKEFPYKYNVKFIQTPWGEHDINEKLITNNLIKDNIITVSEVTTKPNIFIQVTIPNEFIPIGRYNIGITAGIETDLCVSSWIKPANNMDLILVSSTFSKNTLQASEYIPVNRVTNQPVQNMPKLKITTDIKVLPEYIDTTIFNSNKKILTTTNLTKQLTEKIPENNVYLYVGAWLNMPKEYTIMPSGSMDRKNVMFTIETFINAFKDKKIKPALLLKISTQTYSTHIQMHLLNILKRYEEIPNAPKIYLLFGELSDSQMAELYNHKKIKGLVLLSHGEGFGRPLLEFAAVGKPIIASNWSGHLDFLGKDSTIFVDGELKLIDKNLARQNKNIFSENAKWFYPSKNKAIEAWRQLDSNLSKYTKAAKKYQKHIINTYDLFSS